MSPLRNRHSGSHTLFSASRFCPASESSSNAPYRDWADLPREHLPELRSLTRTSFILERGSSLWLASIVHELRTGSGERRLAVLYLWEEDLGLVPVEIMTKTRRIMSCKSSWRTKSWRHRKSLPTLIFGPAERCPLRWYRKVARQYSLRPDLGD